MLIDLLSTSNYGMYNISVARLFDLHSAVYLNALVDINQKAIRKNKIDEDFFILDRKYITSRTTLSDKEQLDIEDNLIKVGVLERDKSDKSRLKIHINVLTALLMNEDETLKGEIKDLVKNKKLTKSEQLIENLCKNILTDNEELHTAYREWIIAVSAKQGWMTKAAVIAAQKTIDEYSNRDLDLALKLIEIASINGYRDMNWAITLFEKNYKKQFYDNIPMDMSNTMVQLSEEKF